MQQGAFSEADEELRVTLTKLDAIENESQVTTLTLDDVTQVRRQLAEGQSQIRETLDRLRQSQEENELLMHRRDETEGRLNALEAEYEELLGLSPYRRLVL